MAYEFFADILGISAEVCLLSGQVLTLTYNQGPIEGNAYLIFRIRPVFNIRSINSKVTSASEHSSFLSTEKELCNCKRGNQSWGS